MHPNEQLITNFYTAFDARDIDTMAASYTEHPQFRDPAFGDLEGDDVMAMWRMLAGRSKDLKVEASRISADDEHGQAHWTARYTFGPTGRKVVNEVDARFEFVNGRIAVHHDEFDFWRWSRQALGPAGLLLGWTPLLRSQVRNQARAQLRAFTAR